ncbi:hypothetical protein IV203_035170 [Nitzschia inconspicua]|uniref:Uncharacterized protein n=1 Tax=Nitzschia inconspicua TaxID=303405 RepID=A0A9K3PUP0_9STRA|nr:hypothetical protein IV203_035170 [Nitzschia inconspicua]
MENVQIKQEHSEAVKTNKNSCDDALSEMKKGSSDNSMSKMGDVGMAEDRDDVSMDDLSSRRGGSEDDREESINSKKSQPKQSPNSKVGKKNSIQPSSSFGQDSYYPPYSQMPPGRGGHYPPHGMHRCPPPPHGHGGPYSHPPPVYYSGGSDYRGHPPPSHYHQMHPPLSHPGQSNHYGGPNGPYMPGRPGPHSHHGYHPSGYGAPYPGPLVGYHGGPSSHYPTNGNSDSNSISSSRSKRSNKSQSSSNGSRKKRTIEGVEGKTDKSNLPLAYSFRRTNSSSSNSTLTTAKNTTDHSSMLDSPHKQPDRASSRNSSYLAALEQSSNIFESERGHRRNNSGTSTASSLSVGGFSLSSYDGPKADGVVDDIPMLKASPKRRKGEDSAPLPVGSTNESSIFKRKGSRMTNPSDQSIDGAESNRFEQLTMDDGESKKDGAVNQNLFLTLSTSPINHPDETPISKNTKKKGGHMTVKTDMDEDFGAHKADTPTPTAFCVQRDMTDEHTLNKHLRGQTFTPLPHSGDNGISPSNAAFSALAPSLSWSIAGDTPSLEDLAGCSWEDTDRDERKRPGSTTSQMSSGTRNMVISPHNFSLWKEEHEGKKKDDDDMKDDGESIRLSMLSPNSEIVDGHGGTTTPLPIFFRESGSDERENLHSDKKQSYGKDFSGKDFVSEHMHPKNMFMQNGPRRPQQYFSHGPPRDGLPPTPVFAGNKPPTPHFPGSSMGFARSPLHGDRRDFGHMYGHPPPGHPSDRIRNLRGRMPPGSHMAPLPLHIPPPMSSHHPLTSPMGLPGRPPWSPHGAMPPPMASPHHMSPIDMSQSKRKCVPLKPPIPSKFQGDMEKLKSATVPEFTSLVNFPAHMSQKQAINLPEGMRCCVMCGQACPCSNGNKKKPCSGTSKKDGTSRGNAPDITDKNGYAIIPTQNKGLCTLCDVNVWVVCTSGLEIKWCKGCKNFRPWAAFGDKGLATKCLRCRERQREKYALQKEEKEKARMLKSKPKA